MTITDCPHQPPCPLADAVDRAAARIVAAHAEQGWNLLCNGVITFDDNGELMPDGTAIAPGPESPEAGVGRAVRADRFEYAGGPQPYAADSGGAAACRPVSRQR